MSGRERGTVCACVVCVQESRCLQRYREAISFQQGGEGQRARDLYQEILDSRVMQEVTSLSLSHLGGGDHSTTAVGVGWRVLWYNAETKVPLTEKHRQHCS